MTRKFSHTKISFRTGTGSLIKSIMLSFDGKTDMCIKKDVTHFLQNCTCVKRNPQWASRGIFDVITAWQQGVWSTMAGISKIRVNNRNVGNFGKKIECTV